MQPLHVVSILDFIQSVKLVQNKYLQGWQENGNVLNVKKVCRNNRVLNKENKTYLLGFFAARPVSAIRILYQEAGLIHSVLKEYKYNAFKFHKTQKLSVAREECSFVWNF